MKRAIAVGFTFLLLQFPSPASSQTPSLTETTQGAAAKTSAQQGRLLSVSLPAPTYPDSLLEYQPADKGTRESGAIVEAPTNPTGSVSDYIIIKDENTSEAHEFFGGKLTPHAGHKLAVLTFEVHNATDTKQSFQVGDIAFMRSSNQPAGFMAVGVGESPPFTKLKPVEQEAARHATVGLQPGARAKVTYVVGVDEREGPLKWSFRKGAWADVPK
jgi:hypothetical protein